MSKTVFITGANRGIGLGLASRFVSLGHTVYCAARNPDGARELWELERDYGKRCRIVGLDVTDERELDAVAAELAGQPIDLLINNAGVLPESSKAFPDVSVEAMRKAFEVNVLGPFRLMQRLLPNLLAADQPVVATVSSKVGSIADNSRGGMYAYRVSKTAANMLNKSFSLDYPRIIAVVVHPGWVQTEMGGSQAPTTVDESTEGLVKVLKGLQPTDTGKFFDFRGAEIAW